MKGGRGQDKEEEGEGEGCKRKRKRSINMRMKPCFGFAHVDARSRYALKKINLIKIVIKSCFDSRKSFFCCFLREIPDQSERNNLNSSFIWLAFFSCYASGRSGDGETLRHSFAHTSPKMVTIILCFKSKSRRKNRFWARKTCDRKCKSEKGKIIGTIFKVNQNQITSKFRNLNHSMASFFMI